MEKRERRCFVGFLAALAAVAFLTWLSGEVLRGTTMSLDLAVRATVHAWASPALTQAARGITFLGAPAFLIPLAIVLVWRLVEIGRRAGAAALIVAVIGAEALEELLKLAFHRPRPAPFFGYAAPLTYSFPSGHSMVSACFYGTVAAIIAARMRSRTRKVLIWAGAVLLILAIGFSRIYLGVHYPTDVLGGYAAAAIWVAAVRGAYEVWARRRRRSTN